MFTLIAESPPLWQVVGALMQDIDLAVGAVGAHDVLLDGVSDPDVFDQFVEFGEGIFPLLRRDDFDNARLHAIAVDFFHLQIDLHVSMGILRVVDVKE